MDIIGLGTDIVETARIKAMFEKFPGRFDSRVFTNAELMLAESKNRIPSFFAGRWAAKEAAAKALGCGIGEKCAFTDIEILNDEYGRPKMTFSGAAAELAEELSVESIKVSISHENRYAVSTVIICGKNR